MVDVSTFYMLPVWKKYITDVVHGVVESRKVFPV